MNHTSNSSSELMHHGFRPQQGLTIMNLGVYEIEGAEYIRFRPQQGLTIMNPYLQNPDKHYLK